MPSTAEANTRASIADTATPSRASWTTHSMSHSLGTVSQRSQPPWPHAAIVGTSIRPDVLSGPVGLSVESDMTLYLGSLKAASIVTKSNRLTPEASSVGGPPVRIRYAVAGHLPAQMSPAGPLVACGIPHAGVHAMRHSAATIALDEGVALAVVQELLGHSDILVTREYTHVSSPLARDGAERVGRALFGEK